MTGLEITLLFQAIKQHKVCEAIVVKHWMTYWPQLRPLTEGTVWGRLTPHFYLGHVRKWSTVTGSLIRQRRQSLEFRLLGRLQSTGNATWDGGDIKGRAPRAQQRGTLRTLAKHWVAPVQVRLSEDNRRLATGGGGGGWFLNEGIRRCKMLGGIAVLASQSGIKRLQFVLWAFC